MCLCYCVFFGGVLCSIVFHCACSRFMFSSFVCVVFALFVYCLVCLLVFVLFCVLCFVCVWFCFDGLLMCLCVLLIVCVISFEKRCCKSIVI